MSDTAMYGKAAACLGDLPQGCQVLILCEDFSAYSRAIQVCRRILDQCGMDMDFDFRCWNFVELVDPGCAHTAAKYAGIADIILLSTNRTSLPPVLSEWLDALHSMRFRADGALLLVLNQIASPLEMEKLVVRMEKVAARLVMDFIPLLPATNESAWRSQPSENWAILTAQPEPADMPNPEHWGLNE
jgi:hypothetical protein